MFDTQEFEPGEVEQRSEWWGIDGGFEAESIAFLSDVGVKSEHGRVAVDFESSKLVNGEFLSNVNVKGEHGDKCVDLELDESVSSEFLSNVGVKGEYGCKGFELRPDKPVDIENIDGNVCKTFVWSGLTLEVGNKFGIVVGNSKIWPGTDECERESHGKLGRLFDGDDVDPDNDVLQGKDSALCGFKLRTEADPLFNVGKLDKVEWWVDDNWGTFEGILAVRGVKSFIKIFKKSWL